MTNEEKAKNIGKVNARQYRHNYGGDEFVFSNEECETSALDMAEWKDNQMTEALDKAIESANAYYDKKLNQNMLYRNIGKIEVLSRLLDKPFPYDKLHINFITAD